MIKKIKITNNKGIGFLRDTTVGKVYDITSFTKVGELDSCDVIATHDSLNFIDDVGDDVAIWEYNNPVYEVVEEEQSMTNNNQVNWDEIPDDVEAVVTYDIADDTFFKMIGGKLYTQLWRHHAYRESVWGGYSDVAGHFGDRFHLRPSPITQPTPEPHESTQVESPEVEATTTPEFDWSSVEGDVEAVITYEGKCKQLFKTVEGVLKYQRVGELEYITSCLYRTLDEREKCISHYRDGTATLIRRPPAITTSEVDMYDIFKGVGSKPSISIILQEAQQSILKHHGVTGKVKFTVTCSE